jgi:multiple antibiotic resistance protein
LTHALSIPLQLSCQATGPQKGAAVARSRQIFDASSHAELTQKVHTLALQPIAEATMAAETVKNILLIVGALFPIVNPIGGSPIFLAFTGNFTTESRKLLAWRVALNSFILLVCSFTIGIHVLTLLGISIPMVQVGGGLVVISTGWAMLKQNDEDDIKTGAVREHAGAPDIFSKAFYPLTLPLTVGPGSISVAITLGANEPRHFGANLLSIFSAVIGSLIIAASIYLCYGFADRLASLLGRNGMSVLLRLYAFLLVCIGVQIFWNGAKVLLKSVVPAAG